jgi:hypothetical protein
MATQLLPIAISLIFISCTSNDNSRQDKISKRVDTLSKRPQMVNTIDSPFYYKDQVGPTPLKGGYEIDYAEDDSMKYLYLKNGNTLRLLNSRGNYTSYWSLGIVEDDYDDYFVLGHDNGNSCPYSYELIDKKSGTNILGKDIDFCSYTILRGRLFLLYYELEKNNLILFNVATKKREYFKLPNDLPEYLDMSIGKLTTKNLTISYNDFTADSSTKKKIYSR